MQQDVEASPWGTVAVREYRTAAALQWRRRESWAWEPRSAMAEAWRYLRAPQAWGYRRPHVPRALPALPVWLRTFSLCDVALDEEGWMWPSILSMG